MTALEPTADNRAVFVGYQPYGVARSNDGGTRLERIWDSNREPVRILDLSPSFHADQTLFALTATSLYRSRNGGLEWQKLPVVIRGRRLSLLVSPNYRRDASVYLAAPELRVSRDAGDSWQALLPEPHRWPVAPAGLAATTDYGSDVDGDVQLLVQRHAGALYVVTDFGDKAILKAVAISPHHAFAQLRTAPRDRSAVMQFFESNSGAANHADVNTRVVVAASGAQLMMSNDAGQAWRAIPARV